MHFYFDIIPTEWERFNVMMQCVHVCHEMNESVKNGRTWKRQFWYTNACSQNNMIRLRQHKNVDDLADNWWNLYIYIYIYNIYIIIYIIIYIYIYDIYNECWNSLSPNILAFLLSTNMYYAASQLNAAV